MHNIHTFLSVLLLMTILLLFPAVNLYCEEIPETPSTESTSMESTEETPQVTPAITIQAPSAILMEASTGSIIYEKDSHMVLPPASITKIMTLLLIFDAVDSGSIHLDDTVTISEYAASMGGSQVFLEPSETQTVNDLIKCISIASANDASVAMAEYISGSESEFVRLMNEKAKALGMADTTFVNCCGLDTDGHDTSAYDVALMSRALITTHPEIHDYCTIWMDTITHTTARGTSEFGLTNTNKLIRQYEYATGLKTGSTSNAKYCVSATAKKDDLELIAVIMAAPDHKVRFSDAVTLLNYGFSHCAVYSDENLDALSDMSVLRGKQAHSSLIYEGPFHYLAVGESDLSSITKELSLPESVNAPVLKGDVAGYAIYKKDGSKIGSVKILYNNSVAAATYGDYLSKLFTRYFSVL